MVDLTLPHQPQRAVLFWSVTDHEYWAGASNAEYADRYRLEMSKPEPERFIQEKTQ